MTDMEYPPIDWERMREVAEMLAPCEYADQEVMLARAFLALDALVGEMAEYIDQSPYISWQVKMRGALLDRAKKIRKIEIAPPGVSPAGEKV